MFTLLNYLQYLLQNPLRFAMKKNTKFLRFCYALFTPVRWVFSIMMYVVLTPLRLINAIYFNIIVYCLWNFRDHFFQIINPKGGGWEKKDAFNYFICWIFGFPIRTIQEIYQFVFKMIEGILFTIIDVLFPALTMRHGTTMEAANNIATQKNYEQWIIGEGAFAGSGVYFGITDKVSNNYENGAIVYARVTLGNIVNLSTQSLSIYNLAGGISSNGDKLVDIARSKWITSFEWWRNSGPWWEYVLLFKKRSRINTWRIRVLYVYNTKTNRNQRIAGGKRSWLQTIFS